MRTDKDIISSRQNRDIVEAVKLCDRKGREKSGLFRIDGIKLSREALDCGVGIERIFVRESSFERIARELGDSADGVRTTLVCDAAFEKLSEEKSPEGIICIAKHLDNLRKIGKIDRRDSFFASEGRVFLAESVRDPGNIGTLVRSANAMGCDRIIVSSDCADLYNPKAMRAAMGAMFRLDIAVVGFFHEAISALIENGRRVFSAALDENAQRLGAFELLPSDCFVIGNEGHGLSEETLKACTGSVFIPMKKGAESLNASAAAAVLLWEQARLFGC